MIEKPGLYLRLFHGFSTPREREMADDWGVQGPLIGPLKYVQVTYLQHVQFEFESVEDARRYPALSTRNATEGELWFAETEADCIYYDGMNYGDFSVAYHA